MAFIVGLAFAIAASANFPALVLAMFWRRFTTRGAQASMLVGTFSALLLIYLSPTIQIGVLGGSTALFPLGNPGLVSIPLSFAVGIAVSLLSREPVGSGRVRATRASAASGRAHNAGVASRARLATMFTCALR